MSADDSSSYLNRFKTVQPKVPTDEQPSSEVVSSNKDVGSSYKDVGNEKVVTSDNLEDSLIREAVQNSDSKITIWSPLTAAMLQYFRRKTPMFSMSSRGREIIESALEEKYPELSKRIKDEMQKGN